MDDHGDSNSEESFSGDDADYVPEKDSSYSDDSYDSDEDSTRRKNGKSAKKSKNYKLPELLKSDSEDETNNDENSSPTKRNFCFVCGKSVGKIARHLKTHSSDIPEIAEAFQFPPFSKERKKMLSEFLKRGNYTHDKELSKSNKPSLPTNTNLKYYCKFCKGLYKLIWNHVQICPLKTEVVYPENLSTEARTILENMQPGIVTFLVRNDPLLMKLAQHLCKRYANGPFKFHYVTQRLRKIGHLLFTLTNNFIFSFEDAMNPENFDKVAEAVKLKGHFNRETQCYEQPQIASHLAYCLKKIATIAITEVSSDAQKRKSARKFMQRCYEEWSYLSSQDITFVATKADSLLFTRDVQRFYRYLQITSTAAMESLAKNNFPNVYSALCKVTLAQLSILNKCTPEISKLKLKTVENMHVPSKNFFMIQKSGKKVLLTREISDALEVLINKRLGCGVNEANQFLFAKPDGSRKSAYHSSQCIKKLSHLCGAKNTQHLTLTVFHKEMSKMFQILSFESDEFQDLEKLLGHNVPTDRSHYQYMKAAPDLSKITTTLMTMKKDKFKGHSLEAIGSDGELEPQVDPSQSEKAGPSEVFLGPPLTFEDELDPDWEATSHQTSAADESKEGLKKASSDTEVRANDAGSSPNHSEKEDLFASTPAICSGDDVEPEERLNPSNSVLIPCSADGHCLSPDQSEDEHGLWSKCSASENGETIRDNFYTKRNFCFICGKAYVKLARHLHTHRRENTEIDDVFAFHKNSKERKMGLEKLRNKGNFLHNQTVLKKGRGKLKVKTKSGHRVFKDYAFCVYCKVMIVREGMYKHAARCPFAPSKSVRRLDILNLVLKKGSTDFLTISPHVMQLLTKLPRDELTNVINKDANLLELAQSWFHSGDVKPLKEVNIRRNLRQMAKLKLELQKQSMSGFEDALKPENFSQVFEAMKEVSGFNDNSKYKPLVMKSLGFLLRKMAAIKYAKALNASDEEMLTEAEMFINICTKQLVNVSLRPGINNPSLIKFTHQVQVLYQHLKKKIAAASKVFSTYSNPSVFNFLLKSIGAQISILNKGIAKISNISLQSFIERNLTPKEEHRVLTPSSFEQILARRLSKIKLKTTLGKDLIVTFTDDMLSVLGLILGKREDCGVHTLNPFLFGGSYKKHHFFYINKCASCFFSRCKLDENDEHFRSIFYRKYSQQLFQILSLRDEELEDVRKLLGFDICTKREHYSKPEAVEDLARISFLLTALENGTMEQYKGKALQEVKLPDELDPDLEARSHQRSAADESRKSNKREETTKRPKRVQKKRKRLSTEETEVNLNTDQPAAKAHGKPSPIRSEQPQVSDCDLDSDPEEDVVNCNNHGDSVGNNAEDTIVREMLGEETRTEDTSPSEKAAERQHKSSPSTEETGVKRKRPEGEESNHEHMHQKITVKTNSEKNEDMNVDQHNDGEIHTESNLLSCSTEEQVEKQSQKKKQNMDLEFISISANIYKDMKNKVLTSLCGRKELKIIVPKINIEKSSTTHLPSTLSKQSNKSFSTEVKKGKNMGFSNESVEKTSKVVHMVCAQCLKVMLNGHTAYQKKGFSDIFCSKECLFKKFSLNLVKTCHLCNVSISRPQDVISAQVDSSGSVKDFCSQACLSSFRSPQSCEICKKPCTETCELKLNGAVLKFCGGYCLKSFFNMGLESCENCQSLCHFKPLKLKLKDNMYICNENCLREYKEKTPASCQCPTCNCFCPVSNTFYFVDENHKVVLFCSGSCRMSYKISLSLSNTASGNKKASPQEKNTDLSRPGLDNCNSLPLTNCYNCSKVIDKPQKLILAPDGLKTFKVCSAACLSAVKEKRTSVPSHCNMCSMCTVCEYKVTVNGESLQMCSDTCYINYHRAKNLPVFQCEVCAQLHHDEHVSLKLEEGVVHICSNTCLHKLKESTELRQPCSTCLSLHLVSDMVESHTDGVWVLFCSSRCETFYKSHSVISGTELNITSPKVFDIKEEKPTTDAKKEKPFNNIKEELMDEAYYQSTTSSEIVEDDEKPAVKKVEATQKTPVFLDSFNISPEDSSDCPIVTYLNTLAPCSTCEKVQEDGCRLYQRRGHPEMFCSPFCLSVFHKEEPATNNCHFCLQMISRTEDVVLDITEGTTNVFCSETCLCYSRHKNKTQHLSATPPLQSSVCSMCRRRCEIKREMVLQNVIYKMCSDPCYLRFCNMNHLCLCVNCGSYCPTPLQCHLKEGRKTLCSTYCLKQYKKTVQSPEPCAMCHSPFSLEKMVEHKTSSDSLELFCSSNCLKASKIQAASGKLQDCDHCGKTTVAVCHLVMSDYSVKSFCTLTCSIAFKESPNMKISAGEASTEASSLPQNEVSTAPDRLLCAQCQRFIKVTPKVIINKGCIDFLCSQTCAMKFKIRKNMVASCEHCSKEKIVKDCLMVDGRECCFCSNSCEMLFRHSLEKSWGRHCRSCAFCLCCSKTLVSAQYKVSTEEFCSENCKTKYQQLHDNLSCCDACGAKGKLTQVLPLIGAVKHFCDLSCLYFFCHKKEHINLGSEPVTSEKSFPVITNVLSLASALRRHQETSKTASQKAQDFHTKVVGHAGVQTEPKLMKNKSMLCAPLVHNKGVSCTTQMATIQTQTEKPPDPIVIPVPVYVPVPMHLYSQYTPIPVGLPLPIPVPILISEAKQKIVNPHSTEA